MTMLSGSIGSTAMEDSLAASPVMLFPLPSVLTCTLVELPMVRIIAGVRAVRSSRARVAAGLSSLVSR